MHAVSGQIRRYIQWQLWAGTNRESLQKAGGRPGTLPLGKKNGILPGARGGSGWTVPGRKNKFVITDADMPVLDPAEAAIRLLGVRRKWSVVDEGCSSVLSQESVDIFV
jgi:hypothetical protein